MEKLLKSIQKISEVLEFLAAVLVLIGIILTLISFVGNFERFQNLLYDASSFKHYLEQVFTIVIGIEFIGMLCRPSSDNVLEVLIFLVARHMVVGDTTPFEDLVSVISVVLLYLVRRYLHDTKERECADE